jgi:hypothetical protein
MEDCRFRLDLLRVPIDQPADELDCKFGTAMPNPQSHPYILTSLHPQLTTSNF